MRTFYSFPKLFIVTLLCFLFKVKFANAQVQTAKAGVTIDANCHGFYEYLPQGYETGTQQYPLLVFLHGIGELGDGNAQLSIVLRNGPPKLISQGTFPVSFTVNNQVFKFIVISPQFLAWPSSANVDDVINYAIAHYRVDKTRIYLTGLSMGGGATWEYAASTTVPYYGDKLAAILPISGASYPTMYKAQQIVKCLLPVWATHNQNDPTVTVQYTISYVDSINKARNIAISQNLPVGPAAKMTIFNASGHDAWTKTYDPNYTENNMNVYQWLLSYTRTTGTVNTPPIASAGPDETITLPTNSVTLSGSGTDADGTIKSYSWSEISGPSQFSFSSTTVSNPTISNLVAGTYTFKLTVTDNLGATGSDNINIIVNTASTPSAGNEKSVKVNVYAGVNPYNDPQWNNWAISVGAATNMTSTAFKYTDGSASTVVANLSQSTAVADNGATYAQTGAMAPGGVMRYTSYSTTARTLTISGLSTSKKYDIELYASRDLNNGNSTDFSTGNESSTVATYANLTNKALLTAVVPDAQGRIIINISKTATYDYLNGFMLTEETAVTTNYLKVNIYAGVNPYNDPQWNNWALSAAAATNMTSTAFKYSDGSTSTMVANLSQSTAVADNGATYAQTGAMAPGSVMRYTSYSTTSRTLTLSGLAVSKKYDIELYASRDLNNGNSTRFTIGGLNTTIATYNDMTDKAVFSGMQPDAQGRITISMATAAGAYNYINGFMITEGSSATTASVNASPVQMMSGQVTSEEQSQSSIEEEGKILRIWPNPVHDAFTLELSDEQRGNLQVQVIDITGAVRRTFNIVKDQNHITQTFSVAGLATGTYILRVQNSSWAGVIKMIKL